MPGKVAALVVPLSFVELVRIFLVVGCEKNRAIEKYLAPRVNITPEKEPETKAIRAVQLVHNQVRIQARGRSRP